MQIDDIVVGSGLWGCTVARILAERGDRVLVLERRDGIGGNSRCDIDPETGIEVHKFGPHIFHTNDEQVWRFVCRFTEFNRYQHKVLALHNNVSYFMPFGLALVNRFYGLNLTPSEMPGFIRSEVEHSMESGVDPESNFETKAVSLIGRPLYEAFMAGYTRSNGAYIHQGSRLKSSGAYLSAPATTSATSTETDGRGFHSMAMARCSEACSTTPISLLRLALTGGYGKLASQRS